MTQTDSSFIFKHLNSL